MCRGLGRLFHRKSHRSLCSAYLTSPEFARRGFTWYRPAPENAKAPSTHDAVGFWKLSAGRVRAAFCRSPSEPTPLFDGKVHFIFLNYRADEGGAEVRALSGASGDGLVSPFSPPRERLPPLGGITAVVLEAPGNGESQGLRPAEAVPRDRQLFRPAVLCFSRGRVNSLRPPGPSNHGSVRLPRGSFSRAALPSRVRRLHAMGGVFGTARRRRYNARQDAATGYPPKPPGRTGCAPW